MTTDETPADVIEAAAKAYREIWLDDVPGIPWDSLGRTAKAAYVDSMRRFAEDGWLADPADRDELAKYKRGAKTLGHIIEQNCHMVLDATGLHDWINEDGDGDWGAVWENLLELKPRAERAEAEVAKLRATVARVRALADEWDRTLQDTLRVEIDELRAALDGEGEQHE